MKRSNDKEKSINKQRKYTTDKKYGQDDLSRYGKDSFQKRDNRPRSASAASVRNDDDGNDGLIIGRNPINEALKAGRPIDTIYANPDAGGSVNSILRIARERDIVIKSVSDAKLSQMCGGASHQGVIASCACAEYVSLEDILAVSEKKDTAPFIIICDEIEDPHNLGAIIRTAEAAGADGIIIPKRRSASLNSTVYKTSAGAASYLPVAKVANLVQAIEKLKEHGIWIYGTQMDAPSYTSADLTGPSALVIGSEGNGMGRLVREKCDMLVSLPMKGKVNSLNASVAAGIFMYETVRQREMAAISGQ